MSENTESVITAPEVNGVQLQQRMTNLLHTLSHSPVENELNVTDCDIFWTIVSIVSRMVSIGLNIAVAMNFYHQGQQDYFWWTLACSLIPMFVTTILQIAMYRQDNKFADKLTIFDVIWNMFLVPFLFRYWNSLYYAAMSRHAERQNQPLKQKKYFELLIKEDSDVALLRIFECFLEVAPQKVLHISIILISKQPAHIFQILAIISSLVSMAWCLASYHRCIRFSQIDKVNISWYGTLFQWLWHFSITVSRVLSIASIATVFPQWTLIACGIHAIIMAFWIFLLDRSPFCSQTTCHSLIFSLILGAVFIFNYILPKVRRTRYRFAIFYTICFIENCTCVALFIYYSDTIQRRQFWFIPLCLLAIIPFLFGLLFMLLYYLHFHPNVVIRREIEKTNSL